jgi:hypothetical protein
MFGVEYARILDGLQILQKEASSSIHHTRNKQIFYILGGLAIMQDQRDN